MFKKVFTLIVLSSMLSYAGWEKLKSNTTEWLTDVFFVDESYGFAVGTNGAILKTIDGGNNWISNSIDRNEWLTSIYFLSKDKGFIVGTNAIVISTTNGGSSWQYSYLPYNLNFSEIFFIDEMTGWIVGGTADEDGIILKTTDGGNSWVPLLTGFFSSLSGVKFKSNDLGYAVARNGTFLRTTNGGTSWSSEVITSYVLQDVELVNNDIWVTGDHGTLMKSTDDGQTWIVLPKKSEDHLYKAVFFDSDFGIVIGGYGTVMNQ